MIKYIKIIVIIIMIRCNSKIGTKVPVVIVVIDEQ